MITYAIFRTFEEEWAWLVKQRAEEGPRGGAMEPTNQGEGSQVGAKLSQVIQIDEEKITQQALIAHFRCPHRLRLESNEPIGTPGLTE